MERFIQQEPHTLYHGNIYRLRIFSSGKNSVLTSFTTERKAQTPFITPHQNTLGLALARDKQ